MTEAALLSKIWNLANVMRYDRAGYGDYFVQNIKESLEKADALCQSILKKAFEGNLLTVQQLAEDKLEKDYESASVLLEKIKKRKE